MACPPTSVPTLWTHRSCHTTHSRHSKNTVPPPPISTGGYTWPAPPQTTHTRLLHVRTVLCTSGSFRLLVSIKCDRGSAIWLPSRPRMNWTKIEPADCAWKGRKPSTARPSHAQSANETERTYAPTSRRSRPTPNFGNPLRISSNLVPYFPLADKFSTNLIVSIMLTMFLHTLAIPP